MRGVSPATFATRLVAMAAMWLILTEGSLRYPWLGAIAAVAGAYLSATLLPTTGLRLSIAGALRFWAYFLTRSLLGGIDVARRALSPRMPLDPGYVVVDLRLREEAARVLLVDVLGLMPGTLGVGLDGERLTLHVLDREAAAADRVRELEEIVARAFRLEL